MRKPRLSGMVASLSLPLDVAGTIDAIISESVQEEKGKIVGAASLKIGNPGHLKESWPMTISIGMLALASLIGAFVEATGIGLRRGRPYSWVAGILGLGVGWLLYGIATASSHRKETDKQWHLDYDKLARSDWTFFALICTAIGLALLLTSILRKPPKDEATQISVMSPDSNCCALPKYGNRP